MATIRVASYNVRDLKDDARAAARVVRCLDPDILCLQEVPRRLLSSLRVSSFAARCGMYWAGRHRGSGGTTIFTSLRVQVAESAHLRLPVGHLQRRRGYAVVRAAPPGSRSLVVASVHLGLDSSERARHAATVMEHLADVTPVVLAGDLNEGDQGRAWGLIAGSLRLVSPTAPTFPAARPRSLLDVVFASDEVRVRPHCEVPLSPADLVAASDHLPVWADLELGPAPRDPLGSG